MSASLVRCVSCDWWDWYVLMTSQQSRKKKIYIRSSLNLGCPRVVSDPTLHIRYSSDLMVRSANHVDMHHVKQFLCVLSCF